MSVPTAREFFFPTRPADPAAQPGLEARFFHSLWMPNGTNKLTFDDRMPDVDAALCDQLRPGQRVRVLDVGVSSGVTTLEMLRALDARGVVTDEAVAVDILIDAFLIRRLGMDLLVDPTGAVLQIAMPGLVHGRPHDTRSPKRAAFAAVIRLLERVAVGGAAGARRGKPVQLISPRLTARPGVRVVEHDLTAHNAPWTGRFDVVRAANVLNFDYFPEATLRRMLEHLLTYMHAGSLLVLCRTHLGEATNHATILRLDAQGRLRPLLRIGDGSEVEPLATALAPTERAAS